jgi:hypothetical protein
VASGFCLLTKPPVSRMAWRHSSASNMYQWVREAGKEP